MPRFPTLLGTFLIVGCASMPQTPTPDLVSSLEVEVSRDTTIALVLHLTNSGTRPIVLEFASAQRYDFEVQTAAGEPVWRWSEDRMFAQMTGTDTIPAGASREYRERWLPGQRRGSFYAVGRLTAANQTIEQRAQFEIPTR